MTWRQGVVRAVHWLCIRWGRLGLFFAWLGRYSGWSYPYLLLLKGVERPVAGGEYREGCARRAGGAWRRVVHGVLRWARPHRLPPMGPLHNVANRGFPPWGVAAFLVPSPRLWWLLGSATLAAGVGPLLLAWWRHPWCPTFPKELYWWGGVVVVLPPLIWRLIYWGTYRIPLLSRLWPTIPPSMRPWFRQILWVRYWRSPLHWMDGSADEVLLQRAMGDFFPRSAHGQQKGDWNVTRLVLVFGGPLLTAKLGLLLGSTLAATLVADAHLELTQILKDSYGSAFLVLALFSILAFHRWVVPGINSHLQYDPLHHSQSIPPLPTLADAVHPPNFDLTKVRIGVPSVVLATLTTELTYLQVIF